MNDGLPLRDLGGSDGHCGGNDSRQTDRNTNDEENQAVHEEIDDPNSAIKPGNPNDCDKDHDKEDKDHANALDHLGEVTFTACRGSNQPRRPPQKRHVAGSSCNDQSIASLDGG